MKTIIIEIIYKPSNEIYVKVGKKETLILSNNKKQITASEIYNCLDYQKNKKYELKELCSYADINEDFNNYLNEIYDIFKTILKDV